MLFCNLLMILVMRALLEGIMYTLIHQPKIVKHCTKNMRDSIGYLYVFEERRVIQFTPDCARHDPDLGYTLKPGTCVFSANEFSNRYKVNHQGLRDDEKSLQKPDIIVVGDSYAMGWGVNQEETFASTLQCCPGFQSPDQMANVARSSGAMTGKNTVWGHDSLLFKLNTNAFVRRTGRTRGPWCHPAAK